MADFELAVADLYRMCSQVWLADKEFWADMEQAELKHAENIHKIGKTVLEKPELFELAHPMRFVALRTSISGIKWNMERIRKKDLSEKNMFFIARDLEQSALEAKYAEILKTDDSDSKSLINEVLSDTVAHRERLDEKIRKMAS